MFDSVPHPLGSNRSEQELATLLYFAEHVNQLKAHGLIKADAPPVFVLDTHRSDTPDKGSSRQINNAYTFTSEDFPSAQELIQHGITKMVYLNEGDQHGKITAYYKSPDRLERDLKQLVSDWEKAEISVRYTGVEPWKKR